MPVVRPIGKLGSLGLVLPTAPQADLPAHPGSTTGTTAGGTRGSTGAAAALARVCTDAEDSGAGALWAVDHLFWPRPMLECLTTLAVATTATRHAVVGSCVLQLPLRRASAVAKAAASLQVLSGGRFVLGIGVGSHPGEYAAAGVDFASRGRLVDEGLAELHRSWDSATDRGSAYRQEPQPSPIPVWIGGSSRAALRRAATAADGWVPLFMSPAEYEVALGHLGEASVAAGRAADEVLRAVVVMVSVGPEPAQATDAGTRWLSSLYGIPPKAFERHLVAGPAESCAEQLQRYFAAGAEHVAVMVTSDQPVEAFAELRGSLGAGAAERAAPAGYRPELVEVAT